MKDNQPASPGGDTAGERVKNIERLQSFLRMERGWDGESAEPIKPLPVMLGIIMQAAPAVVPLIDGGIQIEWHRDGWDIELEISADGTANLYFESPAVKPEP